MKVFSKIINNKTKELDCIICGDVPFEGYSELKREQAYNGKWYLAGYAPEEPAEDREAKFKKTFFEIPNFGWFRKVPKGYSSAVESLNTAFNAVSILQKLPAGMLIFYTAPDFTDPEQCTEEWLIEHQTTNEEMSLQEFGAFYMSFMTAWNTQEHINEVENEL